MIEAQKCMETFQYAQAHIGHLEYNTDCRPTG